MNFFVPDVWRMSRRDVKLLCPLCGVLYPYAKLSRAELKKLVNVTCYVKLRTEFLELTESAAHTPCERSDRIEFLNDYLMTHRREFEEAPFCCTRCEGSKLVLPDTHYFQTIDEEPWAQFVKEVHKK